MKNVSLIIFFLVVAMQLVQAQDDLLDKWSISLIEGKNSDILYIDSYYNIPMPQEKLLKKIAVEKSWFAQRKPFMVEEGIDSARHYGGNCFKMTFFTLQDTLYLFSDKSQYPYRMTGEIYKLDSTDIAEIRARMGIYESPEDIKKREYREARAALPVVYDVNIVIQYGGESKFAFLLPKINVMRKHHLQSATPYYGLEIGPHFDINFMPYYGSLSGVIGIEKSFFSTEIFSTETSLSYFRDIGGCNQTLANLKIGVGIEQGRIKIGRSFLLQETAVGEERDPLLDIGKINGQIWGIEFQFMLNYQ